MDVEGALSTDTFFGEGRATGGAKAAENCLRCPLDGEGGPLLALDLGLAGETGGGAMGALEDAGVSLGSEKTEEVGGGWNTEEIDSVFAGAWNIGACEVSGTETSDVGMEGYIDGIAEVPAEVLCLGVEWPGGMILP